MTGRRVIRIAPRGLFLAAIAVACADGADHLETVVKDGVVAGEGP